MQDSSTSMGTDATFEVSRVCTVVQATTNHQLGNCLPNMDDILTEYRTATIANFSWSGIGADAFTSALDRAYSEVCGWKRNIFTLPSVDQVKHLLLKQPVSSPHLQHILL